MTLYEKETFTMLETVSTTPLQNPGSIMIVSSSVDGREVLAKYCQVSVVADLDTNCTEIEQGEAGLLMVDGTTDYDDPHQPYLVTNEIASAQDVYAAVGMAAVEIVAESWGWFIIEGKAINCLTDGGADMIQGVWVQLIDSAGEGTILDVTSTPRANGIGYLLETDAATVHLAEVWCTFPFIL